MAYILRTHVKKKYLFYGLQSVYGIGPFLSQQICKRLGFKMTFLVKDLTDEQLFQISQCVEELGIPLKGELQRQLKQNLDKLLTLKTIRGVRRRQGLPVRGQRTHTNARTPKKLRFLKK
uniref:Ribosomal protein S13 n=1 Tax=Trachydiscus minutus TaxID=1032745 RepID=A0A140F2Q9_9STRA|nr:ribosomal protein S13 [Trachydiscus minutus]AML60693.1 ribosomal protein S13 [Trachydiscus minutus]